MQVTGSILTVRISDSPVNIAHFRDLTREPGCVPATWLPSRLLILLYLRLIAQHGVQKRRVNLDFSVVVDESLFPELVHEEADAGSGGADHFGQRFLTKRDRNRLSAFPAEIGEQQKQACQASFAGIEQLVDQVVFDPAISRQQVG